MSRLVLVGSGPNHFEIIKSLAQSSKRNHQVLLVSDQRRVFDQSLLPKYLMRLLTLDQCSLDLWKACQRAGVEFIFDKVVRWDREGQLIELENSGPLNYDELSIECASESLDPRLQQGAQNYIVPSKPYTSFLDRFGEFVSEVKKHCPRDLRVVFSGARLPVVELALAVRSQLVTLCRHTEIVIFTEDLDWLPDVGRWQKKSLLKQLKKLGFRFLTDKTLDRVDQHSLYFCDGSQMDMDIFIPAEHYRPQELFARLMSSSNKKLYVEPTLQLAKDPKVYVHGDCVRWVRGNREFLLTDEKEQLDVLSKNILRDRPEDPLVSYRYRPHKIYELPISDHEQIQFFGTFARVKRWDRTDWQRAMGRTLAVRKEVALNNTAETQAQSLEKFEAGHARRPWERPRSWRTPQDKGRLKLISTRGYNWWGDSATSSRYLSQLVLAKSICQGIIPESMRLTLVIPEGDSGWSQHLFQSSLRAVERVCEEEKVYFGGGDTMTGPYWSLALTVAGQQMETHRQFFQQDDHVILTRPLGFGLLWSGRRQPSFRGPWIEEAMDYPVNPGVESLVEFFNDFDVRAAVMVEEWGFLYHCMQALPVDQQLVVNFREIPKWSGIDEVLRQPQKVPLTDDNWSRISPDVNFERANVSPSNSILWDSRSHGAMALGVSSKNWKMALDSLHKIGFTDATLVGCIRPKQSQKKVVLSDWMVQ